MLTVHAEACKHLDSTLREIRKAGMKVGVAINPGTPEMCVRDRCRTGQKSESGLCICVRAADRKSSKSVCACRWNGRA